MDVKLFTQRLHELVAECGGRLTNFQAERPVDYSPALGNTSKEVETLRVNFAVTIEHIPTEE